MTTPDGTRIGLLGLGNMGAAIAQALLRSHHILGYDVSGERRQEAAALGVHVTERLSDFAECETVILCLPSPAISRAVATDLLDVLAPGAVLVETSTVNPHDMRALAALMADSGVHLVEAAILSGVGAMASGKAILLTAGDSEVLTRVEPLLVDMSARIIPFGPIGSAMTAKVVNNAVAHAVMVVLVEAVAMARAEGLDIETISALLADPEAGLTRPLTHRIRERVAAGDYRGGMPMQAARKDSVLALELAQAHEIPLFAIQGAHTVYEMALAADLARDDYAALATLWPQFAGETS